MLYTDWPAKWGFNYTNISHMAQTISVAGFNHDGQRTSGLLSNMESYIKAALIL